jgi:mannonate dehydratase
MEIPVNTIKTMNSTLSRRKIMQAVGAAALLPSMAPGAPVLGMRAEGRDTPKLCLDISVSDLSEDALRRVKQLGVDCVYMATSPPIPWDEATIRSLMERLKNGGLTLGNMMIPWMTPSRTANGSFPNAIFGRPGRDEEIEKVRQSIRAAGRAGLPVVEYNWYAHRATDGYSPEIGRGGAGLNSFDYDRMKDLPPLPEEGAHSLEEMWSNITYFLKAVVPVAEESGVRLTLHPNDPPPPISRGSGQIMGSLEGWKRLIEIVPSKSNGITYDCGVTRELGEDPVEVCRYFGTRDRINMVHFRNVRTRVPRLKYTEVFPDEGEVNMLAVMKELVRQKYPRLVFPEHPSRLDGYRDQPRSGGYASWAYNVAYARAMLQAAMES